MVKEETVYFIAVQQCHLCVNKALFVPLKIQITNFNQHHYYLCMEGKNLTPEEIHTNVPYLSKNLFAHSK
jgi:hypothetical protein